ncbi:flagellar hook-associated protein FlgL [Xylophilus sp.]|uniref:flagellar hook-associated protein FlgL n=1 Tax=Xylophilus sp. TaxID=2653893 RepID=UPI0013BB3A1F|nr:flagellar hook-associated protein FlgL [Xylophilus sp.]KAF1044620.1 MAG: Flagellar hook-associated protein 3 [Xylophilus sp.]
MAANYTRVGSYNALDNTIRNLTARYASLTQLQENLTSGKRVLRPSDDPTAAAQAERAITRIARVQADQRALDNQRNTMALTESTLKNSVDLLQDARELVVQAGGAGLTADNRATIANQIKAISEQLLGLANTQDTNGLPVFSGLGSAGTPFASTGNAAPDDYTYQGLAGQSASGEVWIPQTLDGDLAWNFHPQRDGVFDARLTLADPTLPLADGEKPLATTPVAITGSPVATGDSYRLSFAVDATTGAKTYQIVDTTTNTPVTATPQPYVDGQEITFDGLKITATGTPHDGDTVDITPQKNVFSVLDNAVDRIRNATDSNAAAQAVAQALGQIDSALKNLNTSRSYAGELLNRADRISGRQETRSTQLEADRSRAEDLDMIQGISDQQNQQTAYQAALGTYAQVQKLSLFNYIS